MPVRPVGRPAFAGVTGGVSRVSSSTGGSPFLGSKLSQTFGTCTPTNLRDLRARLVFPV